MPMSSQSPLPRISSMGQFIWDPVWAVWEHLNGSCDLVHVIRGKVRLHVEGRVYAAEAGDTLIIPPERPHRDEFPIESVFEALLVQFTWDDIERWFDPSINAPLLTLPPAYKQAFKRELLQMYETFRADRPLSRELNDARLLALLALMRSGVAQTQRTGRDEERFDQDRQVQVIRLVKEYIACNLSRPIALRDIADHLGMSTYHLSHVFSSASGFRLSEYLTHERMQEAARRLHDPRVRISEAAYAVGYNDPNYFTKAFRKHFGMSPSQYRLSNRKELP
ncbi:MAG: helix-turn-helix domain-containing protein [Chitinivibrionales bacterium]|nr:helix-turn-helix domain-containing protein [Chitinivibrionales bacterium]